MLAHTHASSLSLLYMSAVSGARQKYPRCPMNFVAGIANGKVEDLQAGHAFMRKYAAALQPTEVRVFMLELLRCYCQSHDMKEVKPFILQTVLVCAEAVGAAAQDTGNAGWYLEVMAELRHVAHEAAQENSSQYAPTLLTGQRIDLVPTADNCFVHLAHQLEAVMWGVFIMCECKSSTSLLAAEVLSNLRYGGADVLSIATSLCSPSSTPLSSFGSLLAEFPPTCFHPSAFLLHAAQGTSLPNLPAYNMHCHITSKLAIPALCNVVAAASGYSCILRYSLVQWQCHA